MDIEYLIMDNGFMYKVYEMISDKGYRLGDYRWGMRDKREEKKLKRDKGKKGKRKKR